MQDFVEYVFIDKCNGKHYELIDTRNRLMSQVSDFISMHKAVVAGPVASERALTGAASLRNEKG